MATGRSTQVTRQIGEHLVASELGRMDIIATPFSGNVPQFDLLASTQTGNAFPVQVKAINGPSWQFNAASFLQIEIKDDYQTVLGPRQGIDQSIVCVLVLLHSAGTDAFTRSRSPIFRSFCGSTIRAAGGQRIHSQHTALYGPSIWSALKDGPHYSSVRTVRLNPSRKRPA